MKKALYKLLKQDEAIAMIITMACVILGLSAIAMVIK